MLQEVDLQHPPTCMLPKLSCEASAENSAEIKALAGIQASQIFLYKTNRYLLLSSTETRAVYMATVNEEICSWLRSRESQLTKSFLLYSSQARGTCETSFWELSAWKILVQLLKANHTGKLKCFYIPHNLQVYSTGGRGGRGRARRESILEQRNFCLLS